MKIKDPEHLFITSQCVYGFWQQQGEKSPAIKLGQSA